MTRSLINPRLSLSTTLPVALGALTLWTATADAGAKWLLVYQRCIGNNVNGGAFTVPIHTFNENGTKASVGLTNQFNLGTAIWGYTNLEGYTRIDPSDPGEAGYRDVRVYDPGVPTDFTPNLYFGDPAVSTARYSYELHWLKVSDDTKVKAYPTMPVYHYDLVDGLASSQYQPPPGYFSDANSAVTWTEPWFQTFVVPPHINRLISAKAWIQGVDKIQYRLSILQDNGGPVNTWPQVGPMLTSRSFHYTEFGPVAVNWGLQDVPVTPGGRYAIKVATTTGTGANMRGTADDNYPGGNLSMMFNGQLVNISNRDMVAVLTGVGYDLTISPPTISLSPASLSPVTTVGANPANQTFTISNSGAGTLSYTITESIPWLSLTPTSGTSTGESDTITVIYNTASLAVGTYNGSITITATGASNTPQSVPVNLTVNPSPFAPVDFDKDGDVDQEDFGHFQACFSGAGYSQPDPACAGARLDADQDVDEVDYLRFRACMTAPNIPADPNCAAG